MAELCSLPLTASVATGAVFDDAQTLGNFARSLPPMRWKALQLSLWTLGTLLSTVACRAIDAHTAQAPAAPVATHVLNFWPWLALGAIAMLLSVISLASSRRLPFGPR